MLSLLILSKNRSQLSQYQSEQLPHSPEKETIASSGCTTLEEAPEIKFVDEKQLTEKPPQPYSLANKRKIKKRLIISTNNR